MYISRFIGQVEHSWLEFSPRMVLWRFLRNLSNFNTFSCKKKICFVAVDVVVKINLIK